jgi:hypothetical protein
MGSCPRDDELCDLLWSCKGSLGPEIHFVVDEHGLHPQLKRLSCLQEAIIASILEHTVPNYGSITVNLTARTATENLSTLLGVSSDLDWRCLTFLRSKKIEAII